MLNCSQVEILLCDSLDGTLAPEARREFETHLAGCAACAELARDSAAVAAFIERVAEPELPRELVTRILQQTARESAQAKLPARGWLRKLIAPMVEPRLVMGMALTVLSFSMMARCAGVKPRQLRATDLEPVKVYASFDDTTHRIWNRTVKFYESLRFVYAIQTQLSQLTDEQEARDRKTAAERPVEERKLSPAPAATDQRPAQAGTDIKSTEQ